MATGLLELDSNLVACVLLHLKPPDLAQVRRLTGWVQLW
jgi:hypothetical protein